MPSASLAARTKSFLGYCRIEKGLAANTIDAYSRDLARFGAWLDPAGSPSVPEDAQRLAKYVDALYKAGLASRSIARHIIAYALFIVSYWNRT